MAVNPIAAVPKNAAKQANLKAPVRHAKTIDAR